MTAYTVTATQSVNTSAGMQLYVAVLTNASLAGTPATGTSTTAYDCSVTTTQVGSIVAGAIASLNSSSALTALANTTLTQYSDTTNSTVYAGYTTSTTASPGATTYGSSTAFNSFYGACGAEIIPASGGSVAVDGSSPAAVTSVSATALTTASFTPPGGSLLVATVATDGNGSGAVTMTGSSSPVLTWTQRVSVVSSVGGTFAYIGVLTAPVPAAAPSLLEDALTNTPVIVAGRAGWRGASHSR